MQNITKLRGVGPISPREGASDFVLNTLQASHGTTKTM